MTMICLNDSLKAILALLCFFLSQLFLANNTCAVENPYEDHFPFKTAIIHYEVKGYETGKETLYVKPGFRALYINTKYSELGKVNPKQGLILSTPNYIYEIDLIKKTGLKIKNFKTTLIKEFNLLLEKEQAIVNKNVKELGTAVPGNMHGKRAPLYKKVLGIECDLVEIFGERVLIWPGANIPLKKNRRSKYDDKIVVTAVKIEKDVPISKGKFELPKGIQISFDAKRNEKLENKTLTQFHFMRTINAVKAAKEDIARAIIKQKIELIDVEMEIPEDEDDTIFADEEVIKNQDVIYEIQSEEELIEDSEIIYDFDN